MSRASLLAATLWLSGCASSGLAPSNLLGLAPTTRTELNRALYGQTVDLTWEDGTVEAGTRAVVVGADSVRYVPRRASVVRVRGTPALVRIDALAGKRGGGASPFLGGAVGGLVASRVLNPRQGPFYIGMVFGAFTAGSILGGKLSGAFERPRPVVLYERGHMDLGRHVEVGLPANAVGLCQSSQTARTEAPRLVP